MLAIFTISILFTGYFHTNSVIAASFEGKIGAVVSGYVMQKTSDGIDDIRFKLKREEDAREKALAEKKAREEKKKAEKRKQEKAKWKKIRSMSLRELDNNGYIDKLCKEYNMSKIWFDRISETESSYGVYTPKNSYNAWGWGIYGNHTNKMGKNWYDSSEKFIESFVSKYGKTPSKRDMRRYCPGGAYDKYF